MSTEMLATLQMWWNLKILKRQDAIASYAPLPGRDGWSDDSLPSPNSPIAKPTISFGEKGNREADSKAATTWSYITLAISVLGFFAALTIYINALRHSVTNDICTRKMSAPSPAFEAVEYQWTSFSDVFQPDIYSGYPTAASEAAWGALWDFGAFGVPVHMLPGLNKSSLDGDFRMVSDDAVGGLLEGAHQIHCLNLVRQFIYRDHWDYSDLPSFSGGPKTRRHHVDHCILTLRMVLTCQSDVTPFFIGQSESGTAVGRSAPRLCRNYPKMVDWVKSNSVFDSIE